MTTKIKIENISSQEHDVEVILEHKTTADTFYHRHVILTPGDTVETYVYKGQNIIIRELGNFSE